MFVLLNMKFAGSLFVSKPMLIVGTTCWLEESAFEIRSEPPPVIVCLPFSHVSVSSML